MTQQILPATELTRKPDYRADIDGLRALAVLAVILFHADCGVNGGFVGVDVFFVISGFLITSLVMPKVIAKEFSFLEFWSRRLTRLLPAVTVMVITVYLLGYFVLLPPDFKELGQSGVAQACAMSNVYFWRESGYFNSASEVKPLLHTWSLSVEEQFYLLFPLMLICLNYLLGRHWNKGMIAIAIASLAWSYYLTPRFPSSAFYLLPCRAWELILGGSLVGLIAKRKLCRWQAELCSALGVMLVVSSIIFFDERTVFPGWLALVPCLGTAAIIFGNTSNETITARVLSWRPFVAIGLLSYSLYLWHWPILAFMNYLVPTGISLAVKSLLLGIIVVLAYLSFRYIETPFRKQRVWRHKAACFAGGISSLAVILCLGLIINVSDGVRGRFSGDVLRIADGRFDRNPLRHKTHDLSPAQIRQRGLERIDKGPRVDNPRVAIIGDSHADALMPAIKRLVDEMEIPTVAATRSATIPLLFTELDDSEGAIRFRDAVGKQLELSSSLTDLILIARWNHYDRTIMNQGNLVTTLNKLREMGIHVTIVHSIPEANMDVPRGVAIAKFLGWKPDWIAVSREDFLESQEEIREILAIQRENEISSVDLSEYFFGEGHKALLIADGRPMFVDSHHLSRHGAERLAGVLRPTFQRIKAKPAQLVPEDVTSVNTKD